MPKMKTNSSAKKRFRVTGNGKVKAGHAFRRHLLTKKSRNRKRQLRQTAYIPSTSMSHVKKLLPYAF
jgi:large subunit ribosomal protein L35